MAVVSDRFGQSFARRSLLLPLNDSELLPPPPPPTPAFPLSLLSPLLLTRTHTLSASDYPVKREAVSLPLLLLHYPISLRLYRTKKS